MPKRYGYIWEELTSIEHCEKAVLYAIRNKKKTRYLMYVKKHYKKYAIRLQKTLLEGWEPGEPRLKTIKEGPRKKARDLKIPSLNDHFVHTVVALILNKYLSKKFYFYACGSLPDRGQTFATKAVEKHLRTHKPKYCALADVRKFYQSVRKKHVMRALRRYFKDETFLELNEKILDQMGDELAIGFALSHWYGQLVLSFVDKQLKEGDSKTFLVRFMDNYVLLNGRKRTLHKLIDKLRSLLESFDLRIKDDWQVFPVKSRMVEFLSYRMDHNRTIIRKSLSVRMSRAFKNAYKNIDAHKARTIMSYKGILKHCDSYNFRTKYLYPYVSLKLCRRLISDADKKRFLLRETRDFLNTPLRDESGCFVSA